MQLTCPWVGSNVWEGSHPGRALESESRGGVVSEERWVNKI